MTASGIAGHVLCRPSPQKGKTPRQGASGLPRVIDSAGELHVGGCKAAERDPVKLAETLLNLELGTGYCFFLLCEDGRCGVC